MKEIPLICIHCRTALRELRSSLQCSGCGASFPIDDGIADFAEGSYYDIFDPSVHEIGATHAEGLQLEVEGSERRIRDFYAPLIRRLAPRARRVLDCGCGNGVSVHILANQGFTAWGNDVSQLRKWQWREREGREHLVVASGERLPFPDGYFDVVISSGVLEHIGTIETPSPNYTVRATEDQRERRIAFLRELGRVTANEGHVFLDFPNGAFPVDFWHGNAPGSARRHALNERFLPTLREVRGLAREAFGDATARPLSPRGRLQFHQAAAHLHGRLLRAPAAALFLLMCIPGFRWIAGTALNPFLVLDITRPA
jgi:SAM-dependent methyltransferase